MEPAPFTVILGVGNSSQIEPQILPELTISFLPLPLSACYWQTRRSLTGSPTVSCGYVSGSFTQENYSSCMCRWAQLTVQLVP